MPDTLTTPHHTYEAAGSTEEPKMALVWGRPHILDLILGLRKEQGRSGCGSMITEAGPSPEGQNWSGRPERPGAKSSWVAL